MPRKSQASGKQPDIGLWWSRSGKINSILTLLYVCARLWLLSRLWGRTIATSSLVGQSTALREELTKFLRPPAFRVVTSRPSISEIGSGEFPQSDPCLLIIECSESSRLLIPQIAQIKQRNPLARIALLGHHWLPDEIAAAFQAGANAYFAEATASAEFQMAIELITQRPASPNAK